MDPNSNINPNPEPTPTTDAPEAPVTADPTAETAAPTTEATSAPVAETATTPAPTPEPQTTPQVAATSRAAAAPTAAKKPLPKKFILIGAIVCAAILLVILGFIFIPKLFRSDDAKLADEIFSENVLIAVKQDDKYGFINLSGKMVIQPQFESASDFLGDKAVVKIKDCDRARIHVDMVVAVAEIEVDQTVAAPVRWERAEGLQTPCDRFF